MTEKILSFHDLTDFRRHLLQEEKSEATIQKYMRDVRAFWVFSDGRPISKDITIAFKHHLQEQKYAIRSINSMLASLNSFLIFLGRTDCRVKSLRCQRQTYCSADRELTRAEYFKLLKASRHQVQLHLILQTLCSTGIRVSELKYFTLEALYAGEVSVQCKNKTRTILLPGKLKKILLDYAKNCRITSGAIFVTRNGKPLDRSNIWSQMKNSARQLVSTLPKYFPIIFVSFLPVPSMKLRKISPSWQTFWATAALKPHAFILWPPDWSTAANWNGLVF